MNVVRLPAWNGPFSRAAAFLALFGGLAPASRAMVIYTLNTVDGTVAFELHLAAPVTSARQLLASAGQIYNGHYGNDPATEIDLDPGALIHSIAPGYDDPVGDLVFATNGLPDSNGGVRTVGWRFDPGAFVADGSYASAAQYGLRGVVAPRPATLTVQGVPEPDAMVGLGVGILGTLRSRRRFGFTGRATRSGRNPI